jgi:succinate dehydrogenase / fumarate reductase flavoprotein subunit
VFGKRAGEYAAAQAKAQKAPMLDDAAIQAAMKKSLEPFDRGAAAENPYKVQSDLQDTMQDLVGIVRLENEMQEALTRLDALNRRAEGSGVDGHREYHSGWHTCLDLRNLLAVSEAITRSAIERKESRGGHFRDDFPDKDPAFGTLNVAVGRNADGTMRVSRIPVPDMPADLKQVIEDEKQ